MASYHKRWDAWRWDRISEGVIQKRKIVETEIFSVDERIAIISGMIAIMGKRKEKVCEKQINILSCQGNEQS